jgi:hypothetical protein
MNPKYYGYKRIIVVELSPAHGILLLPVYFRGFGDCAFVLFQNPCRTAVIFIVIVHLIMWLYVMRLTAGVVGIW